MGLINRMTADADLEAVVGELCASIAGNAPLTVRSAKLMIEELDKPSGEPDFERCEDLMRACFASEDYTEGRTEFMEKRKPNFKGR